MRRPTSAFARAVLGTVVAASTVSAQQTPPPPAGAAAAAADPPALNAARSARYLLRNGWDYITYQEYERSLLYFREAESRAFELNDAEKLRLKQGIERAQRGLQEASNGVAAERSYARSGPARRPGALALARPSRAANAPAVVEREPIQLAGGGAVAAASTVVTQTPPPAAGDVPAVAPEAVSNLAPVPTQTPPPIPPPPDVEAPAALPVTEPQQVQAPLPAQAPTPEPAPALPQTRDTAPASLETPLTLPEIPTPAAEPELPTAPAPAPAAESAPAPASAPASPRLELGRTDGQRVEATPLPEIPVPAAPAAAAAALDRPPSPEDVVLPTLPSMPDEPATAPLPVAPQIANADADGDRRPMPAPRPEFDEASLPQLPPSLNPTTPTTTPTADPPPAPAAETLPTNAPAAAAAPVAESVPALGQPDPAPADLPNPAPTAEPAPVPVPVPVPVPDTPPAPMPVTSTPASGRSRYGNDTFIPERTGEYKSTLSPELQRDVDRIAARQEAEMKRDANNPAPNPADDPGAAAGSNGPTSTRLEITRAPSPTEARPIRAIPVPEEFVPLPKRQWEPNRKLWSAAATCHLPLYFQDAALERYGYNMEQHFGRLGRFMSIPIDDPRYSKQRNQIVQPFFSMGLFAAQIALLPYNMIMDPPWESEYDLGYYRPGDRVPTDVFYLPLTGIGPPLKGKNYAVPANSSNGAPLPPSRW